MTTPPAAQLTLTTDKGVYVPGDTITVTGVYSDPSQASSTLTLSGTATAADGTTVQASTTVQVITPVSNPMDVAVTDSFGDAYSVQNDDRTSTVVLTATVGNPPA